MGNIENLTDRQKEHLFEFIQESILLTEEEKDAIDKQISMTQALFEQCIVHCVEIGAMYRFNCLIDEYPEFADEYVRKTEAAMTDIKLPAETPEEKERDLQKLYTKIRARYGEEVI